VTEDARCLPDVVLHNRIIVAGDHETTTTTFCLVLSSTHGKFVTAW
jgi:hypothetical protein